MVKCNSCSYSGNDITIFECPKCNSKIVRCSRCKRLSISYKCLNCNFEGP
ncbi:MAG: RNA-binding protein [Candidatus Pacearchaeota archaeon]